MALEMTQARALLNLLVESPGVKLLSSGCMRPGVEPFMPAMLEKKPGSTMAAPMMPENSAVPGPEAGGPYTCAPV